ncbi:YEATS domain-containing protein 4 [Drosophila tropicalis]|uniref:YEATS domain-containing protein 4 n=1 Tax=Drosophila tropicalis TaxID=46794 RepID=UPI0035AC203E
MSYTNLMQHQNVVDGCQRFSCNRFYSTTGGSALMGGGGGHRVVLCKEFAIGCKLEQKDCYQPQVVERTWCVYIRELDNVDMGCYVRRVSFRMSPRLPLRLHVADASPFEITEVLDTDFPIEIQVEYSDLKMTPTTYIYQPKGILNGKHYLDIRHDFKGEEHKDRMVFVNPSESMKVTLTTPTPSKVPSSREQMEELSSPTKKEKDKVKAQKPQQPKWRLNIRGPLLPPLDKKD